MRASSSSRLGVWITFQICTQKQLELVRGTQCRVVNGRLYGTVEILTSVVQLNLRRTTEPDARVGRDGARANELDGVELVELVHVGKRGWWSELELELELARRSRGARTRGW